MNKEKLIVAGLKSSLETETNDDLFWELINMYQETIQICSSSKSSAGINTGLVKIWTTFENYYDL